jgi:hypothetical protein
MKTLPLTRSISLAISLALLGTACTPEGAQPSCEGGNLSPESYLFVKPDESDSVSRVILVAKRSVPTTDIFRLGEKTVNSAIYTHDGHIQAGDWNTFTKESSVTSNYEGLWIVPFMVHDEPLSSEEEICVDSSGVHRRK